MAPVAPVFIDGERSVTLKGDRIAQEFQAIVTDYVERRFGRTPAHGGVDVQCPAVDDDAEGRVAPIPGTKTPQ